jgi:hypothetical protein
VASTPNVTNLSPVACRFGASTINRVSSTVQTNGSMFRMAIMPDVGQGITAAHFSRTRRPGDPARTLVGFLVPQPRTATVQPVFARPDRSARVIRRVTTKNLDALQTTGSIPHQVLVLERRPGWYRVAPANQSLGQMEGAWLEEASAWRFHAVTDDVERGKLAERAWGPEKWRTRTVGTRRVGDALWFEVEVLSHSFCEDPRRPAVVRARGWIPAHAPSGLPNIWFYSRGC